MKKTFQDCGINLVGSWNGNKLTTCPECSQARQKKNIKCLSVNFEKGQWNCHHCGWSGGLSEHSIIYNNFSIDKPKNVINNTIKDAIKKLRVIDIEHREYLNSRGISDQTIKEIRIGSCTKYIHRLQKEVPVIAIPIRKNNSVVAIKYRTVEKDITAETGGEQVAINYNILHDNKTIIITEGEIDLFSIHEAGFHNVISVPNGAPSENSNNNDGRFLWIDDKIKNCNTIGIMVDNDAAGNKLKKEIIDRVGVEKCFIPNYPEKCKDANDILMKHGRSKLIEVIGKN